MKLILNGVSFDLVSMIPPFGIIAALLLINKLEMYTDCVGLLRNDTTNII